MGGKGGSQTTVQAYQPTAEEKRLQKQLADYGDAVAPNALALNNIAGKLLYGSYGTVQADYDKMNKQAQAQLANAQQGVVGLQNGVLPSAYQQNMENSIRSGVQNSMGNLLNDLGNRGVLNSSVTTQGIKGINDSAATAMTNAYNNNIAQLSGLYGQSAQLAGQPTVLSAANQEAAQQPALNLWNASVGLNQGGSGTALNAVAGQGTTTANQRYSGGGGLAGNMLGAGIGGLASNAGLFTCFAEDTKIRMADGAEKEIRHIEVGDEVATPKDNGADGNVLVTKLMKPVYEDIYAVICQDGYLAKSVDCTLSQEFLNENGHFVALCSLRIGDKLKGGGKVVSIIYSGERKVYDFATKGNAPFYANSFVVNGIDE